MGILVATLNVCYGMGKVINNNKYLGDNLFFFVNFHDCINNMDLIVYLNGL